MNNIVYSARMCLLLKRTTHALLGQCVESRTLDTSNYLSKNLNGSLDWSNPMAPAAAKMFLFLEDEAPENSIRRAYPLSFLRCIVWCPSEVLLRWEFIPFSIYRLV